MTVLLIVTSSCASRDRGSAYQEPIAVMCIENNPAVIIPGFAQDLENQLISRGIRVNIIEQYSECSNPFVLKYVAQRSMGTVTFITLDLYQNKNKVAYIDWDAGRGMSPMKISIEVKRSVKYWQLAEALGALFGDFTKE